MGYVYRQTPDNLTLSILCFRVICQTEVYNQYAYMLSGSQNAYKTICKKYRGSRFSQTQFKDFVLLNFACKMLEKIAHKVT